MVIYGWRGKVISVGQDLAEVGCDGCGQKTLRPVVVQRYFHVFWIPVIPIGKKVVFECTHCKKTLQANQGTATLASIADQAKAAAKTPLHNYLGLAAIVVLVGIAGIGSRIESSNTKAWVGSPAVGDFYVLDASKVLREADKNFKYVVARVHKVTSEGVEIQFGTYGYSGSGGAKDAIRGGAARASGYFVEKDLPLSRAQLSSWHQDGTLWAVLRQ